MTRYILFFISLSLCLLATDTFGQYRNTELKGDHTVKIMGHIGPSEGGTGIAHQYYFRQSLGVQTHLDVVFPASGGYHYKDEYKLSGLGWRLAPELRYYTRRKARNNMTSFFWGLGPFIKYIQFDERTWERRYPSASISYQQLNITNYRNFALGLMGRGGIEAYIGKPQRIVFEASFAFGVAQNWVTTKGDTPNSDDRYTYNEPILSDNRNRGFYPDMDVRVGIGYRLFGKTHE